MVGTYVLYTLSTSGPETKKDRIIEIAAGLYENGELNSEQHWIVSLSSLVPGSQDQEGDQKNRGDAGKKMLEDFLNYSEEYTLVVCRESDEDFLRYNLRRVLKEKLTVEVLNFSELAGVILPELWRYDFESLLKHYGVQDQDQMTTPVRVRLMSQVWDRFLAETDRLDLDLLNRINALLESVEWKYKNFFKSLHMGRTEKNKDPKGQPKVSSPPPGGGPPPAKFHSPSKNSKFRIDPAGLEALFAPDGTLADRFPGSEHRPGPADMAPKVLSTLENGRSLLVESPAGIGKNLSYLVPTAYHAYSTGEGVVVAASTRNSQEHLWRKEVPDLKAALSLDLDVSLVKGWSASLCLLKWHDLLQEAQLQDEERIALVYLSIWLDRTKSGNLDEVRVSPPYYGIFKSLSGRMSIEGDVCLGQECHWFRDCFVMKAKDDVESSHLSITNHDVLLSDLSSETNMFAAGKHLIIAEAHNLESSAIEGLGVGLSQENLERIIEGVGGIVARLEDVLGSEGLKELDEKTVDSMDEHRHKLETGAERARLGAEHFFTQMTEIIKSKGQLTSFGKLRLKDQIISDLSEPKEELISSLSGLAATVGGLLEGLTPLSSVSLSPTPGARVSEIISSVSVLAREVGALVDKAGFLLGVEEDGYVYWAQARAGGIHLRALPIDLGHGLYRSVYGSFKSVVITSDTLAVEGSLDYLAESLGGDLITEDRLDKALIPSVFDYENQLLLCVPSYLSEPTKDSFIDEFSELAITVSKLVDGRSMFLFTSYSMLNSVHHKIMPDLAEEEIEVLGQGLDGTRRSIAKRFGENPHSILLCTEGFWEGLEMPDDGIRCLIMAKLPFPVPNEPTVEARMELLKSQGLNPFDSFMVPQAVIKFRGGFGRLTQGGEHKRVAVVADRRIITSPYGRRFFHSLPIMEPLSCKHEGELIGWIREWLKERPLGDKSGI